MKSDNERKAELEARRDELHGKLRDIDAQLDAPETADWEDQATENEDDEVLVGLGEAGMLETRMIEAALARIAAGEYGDCVTCGERISEERLDTIPSTPFCHIHAR